MGETKSGKKKDMQKRVEELTEILQRTQASLENYRKQTEKRIQEIHDLANKELIIQLLTILDNFELALNNTMNSSKEFVKGVKLIYSQLFTILENNGLKQIKTKNQIFNPRAHEALMKVDSNKPENMVLEELQKGYTLNDKVIRHAKVKISAGKNKTKENNNEQNNGGNKKNDR
jgi:molecular chaperone GrpE